jgi:hypothetical protein
MYSRNQFKQKTTTDKKPGEPDAIKVDGFEQVLAMLKMADPDFRESLLKRLEARDSKLAKSLRAAI